MIIAIFDASQNLKLNKKNLIYLTNKREDILAILDLYHIDEAIIYFIRKNIDLKDFEQSLAN